MIALNGQGRCIDTTRALDSAQRLREIMDVLLTKRLASLLSKRKGINQNSQNTRCENASFAGL